MKLILSCTNRRNSNSLKVSKILQKIYEEEGEKVEIMSLKDLPLKDLIDNPFENTPSSIKPSLEKIAKAKGLILVCPEYNGGIPGLIKHFIDHWIYPQSFVFKPVCFVGLGGRFGALNPILHLQSIFLYRQALVFPTRVLLTHIEKILKEGELTEPETLERLKKQARNFIKFSQILSKKDFE